MDFIKELELYLENTPELLGQKLLIIQAMQDPAIDETQIKKAWEGLITAGVKQFLEESETDGAFAFEDMDMLTAKYIKEERQMIKAGAYKELDLMAQEATAAPAEAAPEVEPVQSVEMSIEDFNDEDKLATALAKEFMKPDSEKYPEILEEIKDSLEYNESYSWRGMADFEADGHEYTVIRSDDAAELIAIDRVKDDLQNEPESFATGDWIKPFYYISDTDKRLISNEDADSYIDDMDDKDVVNEFADDDDKAKFEHDEDSVDMDKIREAAKEEYSGTKYKEMEKDPLKYCEELGYDVGENKPTFLQLDEGAAAQHAVDTDGWAHTLSNYDGNYETTPEGLVYYRRN